MSTPSPARVSAGVPDGGQFATQHKPEAGISLDFPGGETAELRAVYDSLTGPQQDFLDNCQDGVGYPTGSASGIHPRTADALADRGLAVVFYGSYGDRCVEMTDRGAQVAEAVPGTKLNEYARMAANEAQLKADTYAMTQHGLPNDAPMYDIERDGQYGNYTGSLVTADDTEVIYESDTRGETEAVMRAEAFLAALDADEDAAGYFADDMFPAAYRLSARRHTADANRYFRTGEEDARANALKEAEELRAAAADYYECDPCGEVTLHEPRGECANSHE